MRNLKAWFMLDDDEIVSQFDRNYARPADQAEVLEKTGVQYYHVTRIPTFRQSIFYIIIRA